MENLRTNNASNNEESSNAEFWRDTVIEQILEIRDSGRTNMFDAKAVFELAMEKEFYALADFIFMNTQGYSKFILTGEREYLVKTQSEPL